MKGEIETAVMPGAHGSPAQPPNPHVLGIEMVQCARGWFLELGGLYVHVQRMRPSGADCWQGVVGAVSVAWQKPVAECIANIERVLLSIRDAIPVSAAEYAASQRCGHGLRAACPRPECHR